jgi:murein DD-endopeptidase MepM/ murein hydrolase activator NlpD
MHIHKTSVLLANTHGENNGVVQVPTRVLRSWKKYLLFLVSVIVCLICVTGVLIHHFTSEHYREELAQANNVKNAINVARAKRSFQSIDESIYRINGFLQERGLAEIRMDNVGGGPDFEIIDINGVAEFYVHQLYEMERTIEFVPLGVPHGGEISSGFGYRRNPFSRRGAQFHTGVDFRGAIGDTIKSTAAGIVELAEWRGSYGRTVIIRHKNDLRTLYGHLSSIDVKVGQEVRAGEFIGRLGNTGRSTGPHLHYEIISSTGRLNPADYFSLDID